MAKRARLVHPRQVEHGFTLIEMLVALLIFAMLASAGVALLRGGVDAQAAIGQHLDSLAAVQRGIASLDADLSQATPRISRTETGTLAPAFFGRAAQKDLPLMQFVRAGWSNPDGLRRPSLQKVEYWWRGDRLERAGYEVLDGGAAPDPATLFEAVEALSLRYRDDQGNWRDEWVPQTPTEMPVLVELDVTRKGMAPLTLRFLVGAGAGQPPKPVLVPTGVPNAG